MKALKWTGLGRRVSFSLRSALIKMIWRVCLLPCQRAQPRADACGNAGCGAGSGRNVSSSREVVRQDLLAWLQHRGAVWTQPLLCCVKRYSQICAFFSQWEETSSLRMMESFLFVWAIQLSHRLIFRAVDSRKWNCILPCNEQCCFDRFDHLVSDIVQSGTAADVHGKQAVQMQHQVQTAVS